MTPDARQTGREIQVELQVCRGLHNSGATTLPRMPHVPSLPPELVRIIARFTEPGAWSTARALSKVWREAIHERTKDPAALDELLLHMHNRGVCPLMIIYGEDDPQSALLERHFPRQEFATNVHHGFVRLSMKLMLDLAQYVAYDRTHKYTFGPGGVLPVARELRHDDVHWLDTRAAVEKWISEEPYLPEADEEMEEHFEAQLFSTFRWVMLRMVDRVRFGSFYVERLDPTHPGRPMTQLQPLIWEMK